VEQRTVTSGTLFLLHKWTLVLYVHEVVSPKLGPSYGYGNKVL